MKVLRLPLLVFAIVFFVIASWLVQAALGIEVSLNRPQYFASVAGESRPDRRCDRMAGKCHAKFGTIIRECA